MELADFISLCYRLDKSGLVWQPEIGDEVVDRTSLDKVSILVDPQGLTPSELRENFLWLPTLEQIIQQFESRQAIVCHAGATNDLSYEVVIKTLTGLIETSARTLRLSLAAALEDLLNNNAVDVIH